MSGACFKSEASLRGVCGRPSLVGGSSLAETSPMVCCMMSGAWYMGESVLEGCESPRQGSDSSLGGVVTVTLLVGVRQDVCDANATSDGAADNVMSDM